MDIWVRAGLVLVANALICGLVCLAPSAFADQTISFCSGNGNYGDADALVTMLLGPQSGEFTGALTPASFAAADAGPSAVIPWLQSAAWLWNLSYDSSAKWISVSQGGYTDGRTALYATNFEITEAALQSATLDIYYAVDDCLGGTNNQGVFLNGTAISGDSRGDKCDSEQWIHRDDIVPLLTLGQNTLFFNATDSSGPGGLLFSATIKTTVAVPEISGFLALSCGLIGLVAAIGRSRR